MDRQPSGHPPQLLVQLLSTPASQAADDEPNDSSGSATEELYGPAGSDDGASGSDDGPPALEGSVAPLADLSRALDLDDDPAAVVARNDAHRRPDVADGPDSDLWSVDQVSALLPRQYRYPVPTFAPRRWPAPAPLTQAEYSARFALEFPEVAALGSVPNVVVAGGAAAWPFGEPSVEVGDVDLFIHGLDPADEGALWGKVRQLAARLTELFLEGTASGEPGGPPRRGRAAVVLQVMSPGVVTLTAALPHLHGCGCGCGREVKVQIILRAYSSVSAILHAFDVPAACVAYDGCRAYTTSLGAYAQVFRTNVVVPAYRSTTYEARLAKYFDRGYALALPHLSPGLLKRGETLALPHLELAPAVARGCFAAGTLKVLAPEGARHVSDYEPRHARIRSIPGVAAYTPPHVNLRQLSSGDGRYVVTGAAKRGGRRARDVEAIPFSRYARRGRGPAFADVFPRAAFDKALRDATSSVLRKGAVHSGTLRRVFGLDDDQVAKFVLAVTRALAAAPGRALDVGPALAAFREGLVAKYEAAPAPIGWWILADPGRQYTASRDPRMEDPAVWYGAAVNAAGAAPTLEDFAESLLATMEARQAGVGEPGLAPVYDGQCPLCQDPLARGAPNSVILPCGHIYHWAETNDGCGGLFAWVARGSSDCPVCRRRFDPEERDEDEEQPQALIVEW